MHNGEEISKLMNRLGLLFIFSSVMLMNSCNLEEIRQEDSRIEDRAVRFAATQYEVVMTRADHEPVSGKRVFLGIAGNDSLFVTASEYDSGSSPTVPTKSTASPVPDKFHVSAFKDNEKSAYLDLMLNSTDSWLTYSPTLYWPVVYEHINFFAYSYNLGENPITPVYDVTDGYSARFNYSIPHSQSGMDDARVQPDLIFAISPAQREAEDPVALNFVHTLSSIEFRYSAIGDAAIVTSSATLNDVISEGICTVTHPVSAENVKWEIADNNDTYSQTIEAGVPFMMIPQNLTGSGASFEISVTIGDVVHTFPPIELGEITPKWEANRKYVYTITKGGEVKVDVRTQQQNTYLNNIKIQNTGFTNAYIRAAVVGYWYVVKDNVEEIAASWDIFDDNTGTLQMPADSRWILKDGIYYYMDVVKPGEYTTPLFESYELTKTTGPVTGSKLNISIAAQAIESEKGKEFWPIDQQ